MQYNLRGLGADKTLTLLNGRRISENTSNIPSAALARTEILKDGAAVIYGADATGGVVNFITRDDFTGPRSQGRSTSTSTGLMATTASAFSAASAKATSTSSGRAEWEHRSRLEVRRA